MSFRSSIAALSFFARRRRLGLRRVPLLCSSLAVQLRRREVMMVNRYGPRRNTTHSSYLFLLVSSAHGDCRYRRKESIDHADVALGLEGGQEASVASSDRRWDVAGRCYGSVISNARGCQIWVDSVAHVVALGYWAGDAALARIRPAAWVPGCRAAAAPTTAAGELLSRLRRWRIIQLSAGGRARPFATALRRRQRYLRACSEGEVRMLSHTHLTHDVQPLSACFQAALRSNKAAQVFSAENLFGGITPKPDPQPKKNICSCIRMEPPKEDKQADGVLLGSMQK